MPPSSSVTRRSFLTATLGPCLAVLAGCGLLLYPERRGQPPGRLDWGVVLLDGLGLLLFFIPGIIAFAVDFATGTIYLPPAYAVPVVPVPVVPYRANRPLTKVLIPRDQLTREKVEEVVSNHLGKPVRLAEGTYQTERLSGIEEFWKAVTRRVNGAA